MLYWNYTKQSGDDDDASIPLQHGEKREEITKNQAADSRNESSFS